MAKVSYYARLEDNTVVEVFSTEQKIEELFHSSVTWAKCSASVKEGWVLGEDGKFSEKPQQGADENSERIWRNGELYSCDIIINKLEDEGSDQTEINKYRKYRVELRNWPEHPQFPFPNYRPILKE